MTEQDLLMGQLCAWRENRGGGHTGMQSVLNVLQNRAKRDGTSIAFEALKKWQFSSMTAPGDPQLDRGPNTLEAVDIATWQLAYELAMEAIEGNLEDITDGAVNYYAESMSPPPSWAASMIYTVTIASQKFFK